MKLIARSRVNAGMTGVPKGLMKTLVFVALVACGGKTTPGTGPGSGSSEPPPPLKDTRTEIEKRRATACGDVGKKITACALADAKAEVAAGRMTKKDFDLNTTPEILDKNTEEFVKKCNVPSMSSRQVRVLEVCSKEEAECAPLLDCLSHLDDQPAK